jgi:hypothetical protein
LTLDADECLFSRTFILTTCWLKRVLVFILLVHATSCRISNLCNVLRGSGLNFVEIWGGFKRLSHRSNGRRILFPWNSRVILQNYLREKRNKLEVKWPYHSKWLSLY